MILHQRSSLGKNYSDTHAIKHPPPRLSLLKCDITITSSCSKHYFLDDKSLPAEPLVDFRQVRAFLHLNMNLCEQKVGGNGEEGSGFLA